ncbi:MAG: hypothetical protein ACJ8F3_13585 [Xanthobacteraceae bacterium]
MRYIAALVLVLAAMAAPVRAAAPVPANLEFTSVDLVNRWVSNYRSKPQPALLPSAVRALSQLGAFKDAESAGIYVGFIAGVIYANPLKADELIAKMGTNAAAADQWVIIRAIAYSGHPEWKALLQQAGERMPPRKVMVERYLSGKLQTLDQIPLEKKDATFWEKVSSPFRSEKPKRLDERTFDTSPELLDTLWGYYFATGSYGPIARIVQLLPWASDRDSVDKLTVGSMAKYTLASNASRDQPLLGLLKAANKNQPKEVALVLSEVIEAAETMETARLRKLALASLEELKRKGPGARRDMSTWGQIGQGALALGCIAAAATGHVELGLPCVIGGAASGAALSFWDKQQ